MAAQPAGRQFVPPPASRRGSLLAAQRLGHVLHHIATLQLRGRFRVRAVERAQVGDVRRGERGRALLGRAGRVHQVEDRA
jgi:hypothetical protein